MVVTIWCAIGTERAGVFAGKMAIGAHLGHEGVFRQTRYFRKRSFDREIPASGLTSPKQANADQQRS
jgi:hypothetical protein